jgi:hypothetical protein
MLLEMQVIEVVLQRGPRTRQAGHADDSPAPLLDEPDPAAYLCCPGPHLPRLLAVSDKANPWLVDHETARNV